MYNIDDEIERTLQSLEGIKPAEPKPFFYTRLQARMESEFEAKTGFRWRPAYAYAALALIITLNAVTIYKVTHRSSGGANAEQLVEEYGMNDLSGFDTN